MNGYSDGEKIDAILGWAEGNANFNTDWLLDVQGNLEKFGSLTARQGEAINNIIYKCEIDVELYV